MSSTVIAIIAFAGLVTGWSLAKMLADKYRRHRIMRRIHCLMGDHSPGPIREVVGGRRQQRCDYCDKLVHEYRVTKDELKREQIRRIY